MSDETKGSVEAAEYLREKQGKGALTYAKMVRWRGLTDPRGPRCTWDEDGKAVYTKADLDAYIADPKSAPRPDKRPVPAHPGGRRKATDKAAQIDKSPLSMFEHLAEREVQTRKIIAEMSKLLTELRNWYPDGK